MRWLALLVLVVLPAGILWAQAAPQASSPDPSSADPASDEVDAAENEAASPSQPAQLGVTLDREEITVGDRVEATLTLVWMGAEPSAPARFPIWQEGWGGAEILEVDDEEPFVDQSGRHIFSQKLQLTSFEVGEVRLPSFEVAVPLEDRTVTLKSEGTSTFEVISVLPPEAEEDPATAGQGAPVPGVPGGPAAGGPPGPPGEGAEEIELRPAAPLRSLPSQQIFWWVTAALALACALAFWALDRRLAQVPEGFEAEGRPVLPPLEEFEKQLVSLNPNLAEPAHTALSFGLRRYLGRRANFQAVESTTSQIQRRLRETPVTPEEASTVMQLLRSCDQVKFARQDVGSAVTRDRLRQARDLVRNLEERLRPRPQLTEDEEDMVESPGRAA